MYSCLIRDKALPRIAIKTGRAVDDKSGPGYRRQIHTCKRGKQANEVNKLITVTEKESESERDIYGAV